MVHSNAKVAAQVLATLISFRRRCKKLRHRDWLLMRQWFRTLDQLRNTPESNGHFITCFWSLNPYDMEIVCTCSFPSIIEYKLEDMINKYYN